MDLEVIEKSRKLLIECMGQENFDKFIKDKKIEIKHGDTLYELDQDAKVYNRTTNQFYCIEPICPDNLPIHDQLAIKYTYVKNNIKKVEEVANKRSLGTRGTIEDNLRNILRPFERARIRANDNELRPDYSGYVNYMECQGWYREQLTLSEMNTTITLVNDVRANTTDSAMELNCPAGQTITIMGVAQVPRGEDARTAHALRVRFADENDKEIDYNTRIRITKENVSGEVIDLARLFYEDINLTVNVNGNNTSYKTDENWYRFKQGVNINGTDRLRLYVVNSERNVSANNTRFAIDCDLWVMG